MKYKDCKTLRDIAEVLNEGGNDLDFYAYMEAAERIGAIITGDETYRAFRRIGNGIFERLCNCGERFIVDEVGFQDVPAYVIDQWRFARVRKF